MGKKWDIWSKYRKSELDATDRAPRIIRKYLHSNKKWGLMGTVYISFIARDYVLPVFKTYSLHDMMHKNKNYKLPIEN